MNSHNKSSREILWEAVNDLDDLVKLGYCRKNGRPNIPPPPSPGGGGDLRQQVVNCSLCPLSNSQGKPDFGDGVEEHPPLMIIGFIPGENGDAEKPAADQRGGGYLDKWLGAIDLSRSRHVFFTSLVKCHPFGGRAVTADELHSCRSFLERQIDILQPSVILCTGADVGASILGSSIDLSLEKSPRLEYRGVPLFVTHKPAEVLADSRLRRRVWEDMKSVKSILNTRGQNN